MDRMAQWVQDALDAIEYANGPTNSVWGAMRAAAGHPAPFNLKYMEIGNENGGFNGYVEHWDLVLQGHQGQISRHQIRGRRLGQFRRLPAGHRGRPLLRHRRNGSCATPACTTKKTATARRFSSANTPSRKIAASGNLRGAIGEAAFMTGMERNSDVGRHGQLRAAARQPEPSRLEPRPHQLRQLALVWSAELLRPEDVQPKIAATFRCPPRWKSPSDRTAGTGG